MRSVKFKVASTKGMFATNWLWCNLHDIRGEIVPKLFWIKLNHCITVMSKLKE